MSTSAQPSSSVSASAPAPVVPGSARGGRKTGRPALGEAEQLTSLILRTATVLFVSQGYAGTTMDMLAREAGVSKKTIYARFADKSQLFETVVQDHVVRHLHSDTVQRLPGNTLTERLYQLGCVLLEWTLQPDVLGLYRVSVAESPRFPELARQIFDRAVMGAHAQTLALLSASELADQPTAAPMPVLANHFLNACITPPFMRALQSQIPPVLDDAVRAQLRMAVTLFLHGACARAPRHEGEGFSENQENRQYTPSSAN